MTDEKAPEPIEKVQEPKDEIAPAQSEQPAKEAVLDIPKETLSKIKAEAINGFLKEHGASSRKEFKAKQVELEDKISAQNKQIEELNKKISEFDTKSKTNQEILSSYWKKTYDSMPEEVRDTFVEEYPDFDTYEVAERLKMLDREKAIHDKYVSRALSKDTKETKDKKKNPPGHATIPEQADNVKKVVELYKKALASSRDYDTQVYLEELRKPENQHIKPWDLVKKN